MLTRGIQTEGPPAARDFETQTSTEEPARVLEGIRTTSAWIASELRQGRTLGPASVVARMPALSSLEAEGLILAVGEGMSTIPPAVPVSGMAGEAIPAAAVRGVCLLAMGPEEEFDLVPPPPVASTPVSIPPIVISTPAMGRPLTATVVVSAERRARRARESRLPHRMPPGTDEGVEREHLSLLFQGRDREAANLRAKHPK
jgi:hypothetical protein